MKPGEKGRAKGRKKEKAGWGEGQEPEVPAIPPSPPPNPRRELARRGLIPRLASQFFSLKGLGEGV